VFESEEIKFKNLWGEKYFPLALISYARFQVSFFFVLVLLMPMLLQYHDFQPDQAVLAYIVAPVSYSLLLPVIHWVRDNNYL